MPDKQETVGWACEMAAGAFSPPFTADMSKLMAIDQVATGNNPGTKKKTVRYGGVIFA